MQTRTATLPDGTRLERTSRVHWQYVTAYRSSAGWVPSWHRTQQAAIEADRALIREGWMDRDLAHAKVQVTA